MVNDFKRAIVELLGGLMTRSFLIIREFSESSFFMMEKNIFQKYLYVLSLKIAILMNL